MSERRVAVRRSRSLTAVGVVVVVLAGGGLLSASAAGSVTVSSFVPMTPCRLLDTRPGSGVGSRSTPIGGQETFVAQATGSNGNCVLPVEASGLSMNVVAVNPSADSYLTVFPSDQSKPLSSSLNWVAGQAPTPNAVTVALSPDGRVSFFNNSGSVDIAVDVVGYYVPSTSGPQGPAGPPGVQGSPGASGAPGLPGADGSDGATPARVLWVATAEGDFSSVKAALAAIGTTLPAASASVPYVVRVAPGVYTEPGGVDAKDYVDIEGSGQDTTTITCACSSSTSPFVDGSSATLRIDGANLHTEIRDITIVNTGSGAHATALWTHNSTAGNVSVRNITARASAAATTWGIEFFTSAATVTDSRIVVSSTSIAIGVGAHVGLSGTGVVRRSDVTASSGSLAFGFFLQGSPFVLDETVVKAQGTGGIATIASAVQLDVGALTMTGGTASASGAAVNYGVKVSNGALSLHGPVVTATGGGGDRGVGVSVEGTSTATLVDVNVTATGSGAGNNNWGVSGQNTATVSIMNSILSGQPNSVVRTSTNPVRVVNTQLLTAAAAGQGILCPASYNYRADFSIIDNCT